MKFGLHLGGGAPVCEKGTLKEVATLAEELGYDSIMIGDHIVLPKRITSPWPYEEYIGGKLLPTSPFYAIYTEKDNGLPNRRVETRQAASLHLPPRILHRSKSR